MSWNCSPNKWAAKKQQDLKSSICFVYSSLWWIPLRSFTRICQLDLLAVPWFNEECLGKGLGYGVVCMNVELYNIYRERERERESEIERYINLYFFTKYVHVYIYAIIHSQRLPSAHFLSQLFFWGWCLREIVHGSDADAQVPNSRNSPWSIPKHHQQKHNEMHLLSPKCRRQQTSHIPHLICTSCRPPS